MGFRMPLILLSLVLTTTLAAPAGAQGTGPYVAGFGGVSAGDGSAAPAGGASFGWMSPRGVGFEIEIAGVAKLDLLDEDDFPRALGPMPAIFPQPTFESTGRLITFQTNALVSTGPRGRWTITPVAGGGVGHLRRRLEFGFPNIVIPPGFFGPFDFTSAPFDFGRLEYSWIEREVTSSESALTLNAGGLVEFALTRRLSTGVDARYLHAFFGEDGLDTARVAARVRWSF